MKKLQWARIVSDLLSPPIIWAVLVFPIAFRYATTGGQALTWALTYGVLVCLMPVLYIVWNVKRGKIGDIHMKERSERTGPFLVSIGCTVLGWQVLRMMGAPMLPTIVVCSIVQLVIMTLITFVWQISMHTMSVTGAVIATGFIFGPVLALVVAPLVPLVGAARLKLQRHTLSQVIAGVLVGGLIPLLILSLR